MPTDRRRARGTLRGEPAARTNALQRAKVLRERLEEMVAKFALSPREREVFELLLHGGSADEIATKLGVSARTVKFHQANLLDKLDADSRLDLFRLFFDAD